MEKFPEIQKARIASDDPRLSKFKLFAELSREELGALVEHCNVMTRNTGERIITAGERGHCMYLILAGRVRVTAPAVSEDIELAVLNAGDFLGEIALVDDGTRSANVTALERSEFLCITRMTLGLLAGLHPSAAIHILAAIGRSLVARLRSGNQRYVDLIVLGHKPA